MAVDQLPWAGAVMRSPQRGITRATTAPITAAGTSVHVPMSSPMIAPSTMTTSTSWEPWR